MVTTEVLEPVELKAMLESIDRRTPSGCRNYAMLVLMAQTGIRCGEALQVETKDIVQEEWDNNGGRQKVWVLRLPRWVTKGKKDRIGIPLTLETMQALDAWREKRAAMGIKNGPLFCTISEGERLTGIAKANTSKLTDEQVAEIRASDEHDLVLAARYGVGRTTIYNARVGNTHAGGDPSVLEPGQKLHSSYVRDMVKRLAKRAGIDRRVHPHMLRHTALTAVYDKTQDLRLTQHLAGHSSSSITERYTHVHPVRLAKAMGVF